jgi:hypothetical protein
MEAELLGVECLSNHPSPRGWHWTTIGEYNLYSNLDGTIYAMYTPTANQLENDR